MLIKSAVLRQPFNFFGREQAIQAANSAEFDAGKQTAAVSRSIRDIS